MVCPVMFSYPNVAVCQYCITIAPRYDILSMFYNNQHSTDVWIIFTSDREITGCNINTIK